MNGIFYYRNSILFSTFLLVVLFAASTVPVSGATTEDHRHHQHMMKSAEKYSKKLENYSIPNVSLLQSDGVNTSLQALVDGNETVLLNFIFTSCTAICPIMSGTFSQVNSRIDNQHDKIRMISISIDPEYDTPARLEAYSKKFGSNSNWIFLTGGLQDIISVQKAFNTYRGKKMNHEPTTFIRAANKSAWLRLDGFASPGDIVNELEKLNDSNH